jgi:peptidase S41-like protein
MIHCTFVCGLALLAAGASPAATAKSSSGVDRSDAVRAIERAIDTTYVFPALRPQIIAQLERSLRANLYNVADPELFARRVTADLEWVSHDGHLYLTSDTAQYAAMLAPAASSDGLDAFRHAIAIRDHSGLTKLEILPGNVRYLKLEQFQWIPDVTRQAYDDAARFLKDGDAVIIDLRSNGGGNSDAADYFSQAFLAPDPLRPDTSQARERDPRWAGKPLYLLVDAGVASAAEAVAYGAQQEKTALVVGSTTYGAANNNKKFPIAPQFVLSVSYNRPVNPISGTNWEGTGVKPDIPSSGVAALDAAQLDALNRLESASNVPPKQLAEYRWASTAIEARLRPVTLDKYSMQRVAGVYGTVELRDTPAGLRFYRSDRPQRPQGVVMIPLNAQGLFSIDGYDDLRAEVTPTGVALLHGADDAREVFSRSN